VESRRLILVKTRASFEQRFPACLSHSTDSARVNVRTWRNDFYLYTSMQCFEQSLHREIIRNEVGIRYPDVTASCRNGYQQHQTPAIGAFTSRALKDLANLVSGAFLFWKIWIAV